MKYVKKLIMLATALVMVLTCMVPAVMADGTDGTITLTNAAVGKEYQAYQILDATYSGDKIAYTTKNPELFSSAPDVWQVQETADANGNYSVRQADGATVSTISAWIAENLAAFTPINPTDGVDADNKTAVDDTVTWSGLAYGYYYITSGLGTAVTVNSVMSNPTVIDKNITNPSDAVKESDSATAQIGDTVSFKVTFTATNYITGSAEDAGVEAVTTQQVTSYTVSDRADGYDYLIDAEHPVTVRVGERETFTVTAEPTQQEAASVGTLEFTIPWADERGNPLYLYSETVTVTYYGVVNAFAHDGLAENTVAVRNSTGTHTLTANTETAAYSLTINKTDDQNRPLTGATFVLHRNANKDAAVALVEITDPDSGPAEATRYYRVAETEETGVTTSIELTKDTYSTAVIYGLDGADTYFLEETQAPEGYNKLPSAVEHPMENSNGIENVQNVAGVVLPSTGGMGTTVFYILGGVMVIGALVVLVTNKRMRNQ